MTDVVREARALLEKATPGPWVHRPPTDDEQKRGEPRRYVTRQVGCGDVPPEKFFIAILYWPTKPERDEADAELIAAAPELISRLCDEVESLRANRIEELLREIKQRLTPEEAEQFQELLMGAARMWMGEVVEKKPKRSAVDEGVIEAFRALPRRKKKYD